MENERIISFDFLHFDIRKWSSVLLKITRSLTFPKTILKMDLWPSGFMLAMWAGGQQHFISVFTSTSHVEPAPICSFNMEGLACYWLVIPGTTQKLLFWTYSQGLISHYTHVADQMIWSAILEQFNWQLDVWQEMWRPTKQRQHQIERSLVYCGLL